MQRHLRSCLAEAIGTFFLTFIAAGAICTDLATGGKLGVLGIAVAYGLAMSIAVSATMNISGGHINPAVTLTMWVYKKIDTDKTIYYIIAQFVGAIIAAGILVAFFGTTADATEGGFGTPHVTKLLQQSTSQAQIVAIGIEAVLTLLLVFAVFGTVVDPKAPKIGGFGVGMTVCAAFLVGGPFTGAALNPARAFGPAIWEAGIRGDFSLLKEFLVYLIGPVVGGILAGGLYLNYILPPDEPSGTITHGK